MIDSSNVADLQTCCQVRLSFVCVRHDLVELIELPRSAEEEHRLRYHLFRSVLNFNWRKSQPTSSWRDLDWTLSDFDTQ
jgi:hypothetical protein